MNALVKDLKKSKIQKEEDSNEDHHIDKVDVNTVDRHKYVKVDAEI